MTKYKFKKGQRVHARKTEPWVKQHPTIDVIGNIKARMRPYKVWSINSCGPGVRDDLPVYEVVFDAAENPGGSNRTSGCWRTLFTEDQIEAVEG